VLSALLMFFVVGLLARLLVSGPSPQGCLPTILLGLAGSFVGGFLGYLISGKDLGDGAIQLSGVFGSLVGSILVLLVYRRFADDQR